MNFFKKIFKSRLKELEPKKTVTFSPLCKKGDNEEIRNALIDYLKKEYPKDSEKIIKNSDYGVGKMNVGTFIILVARNDARELIKDEYSSFLENRSIFKGSVFFGLDKEGKLVKAEPILPNSKQGKFLYKN